MTICGRVWYSVFLLCTLTMNGFPTIHLCLLIMLHCAFINQHPLANVLIYPRRSRKCITRLHWKKALLSRCFVVPLSHKVISHSLLSLKSSSQMPGMHKEFEFNAKFVALWIIVGFLTCGISRAICVWGHVGRITMPTWIQVEKTLCWGVWSDSSFNIRFQLRQGK